MSPEPRPQRGAWDQAIGTSRGGPTSKIHCLADACGRPTAFVIIPANVADITMGTSLLGVAAPARHLIADKPYDADSLRNWLKRRRIKAVTSSTTTRTVPYPLEHQAYRWRNVIEHFFGRLKD